MWFWLALQAAPAADYEVVVLGATPGGIMAAVAAARLGRSVLLLERGEHLGGLPANGLGATDITTRGATGGLFREFVQRIRAAYVAEYGADSPQVRDCSDGYHFEPHVAEAVFEAMLAEQPSITTLRRRQFDALPENLVKQGARLVEITVRDRDSGAIERYRGGCFVDATYEGDLAAAAGAPFSTRREGRDETGESLAGRVYKRWGGAVDPASTHEGDETIQAYNYRLCLTREPDNRLPIPRPAVYDRAEYLSLIDDIVERRTTGGTVPEGIARLTNMVSLPNGKFDANNQHFAFLSTDLPEENYPWPTADWAWRDRFALRLRDYTLGLFWFAQHDQAVPAEFRHACLEWGLAADEYRDNGGFPRQVYVREGRRVEGEYRFSGHDALPVADGARPPVAADSITASHYPIDSHAHRKREPERWHLDGFLSQPTRPYTVPYGVIVPREVDGLLVPVAVSATHLGFGTLRMEPCWMAMGQAAGTAAHLALAAGVAPRRLDPLPLQLQLLDDGAVLVYFRDAAPGDPGYAALQLLALRGAIDGWEARLDQPATADEAQAWSESLGAGLPDGFTAGQTTRGELLARLAP